MKKILLSVLSLMLLSGSTQAHYLWIETAGNGQLNNPHHIKIRFGEYTYGVIEETSGEAFQSVNNYDLWLLSPSGEKTALESTPRKDHYLATFIPTETGTYTIALDNKQMQVLDYSQYNIGIMKPQYHCKARVVVGPDYTGTPATNPKGIEFVELSTNQYKVGNKVRLKVFFKGQALPKQEVTISVDDLWTRKARTDEQGEITFNLPWQKLYTAETTYNEEVPGSFESIDYEYIWHCGTYCFTAIATNPF